MFNRPAWIRRGRRPSAGARALAAYLLVFASSGTLVTERSAAGTDDQSCAGHGHEASSDHHGAHAADTTYAPQAADRDDGCPHCPDLDCQWNTACADGAPAALRSPDSAAVTASVRGPSIVSAGQLISAPRIVGLPPPRRVG